MSSPTRTKSSIALHALDEPIQEHSEYVRNQLTKLWGDDIADYFVNSKNEIINPDKLRQVDENTKQGSAKLNKRQYQGMYAHQIWRGIRDESTVRLKPFDLNEELQNIHYYDKVKNSMDTYLRNEVYNKSKRVEKTARNEEELMRNKNVVDMRRIKQIKSLRNEVELMYRSSRMNQEKFGVLRAHSPIPDLNDRNGFESIGRYLPPMILKEKNKTLKSDSKLEFITSPLMRERYQERLEEKLTEEKKKVLNTMIENSVLNKDATSGFQPVKMVFLTEKNAADSEWRISALDNAFKMIRNSEEPSEPVEMTPKEEPLDELKAKRAVVYPPLSLNALNEYKNALKAPGRGDFKHGKPELWKPI